MFDFLRKSATPIEDDTFTNEEDILTVAAETKNKRRPWFLLGTVIGSLIIVCGIAWLYFSSIKPHSPADNSQQEIAALVSVSDTKEASAPQQLKTPDTAPLLKENKEAPASKPTEPIKPAAGDNGNMQKSPNNAAGFGKNPFIDIATLHVGSNPAGLPLPLINGSGERMLPDIPRPMVSPEMLPSPGEIQTPPPSGLASTGGPLASMGGIINKADGSAIAIMNDGTVLSEGDTYKGDRRVTFIGGDGIKFDNGESVPFGKKK